LLEEIVEDLNGRAVASKGHGKLVAQRQGAGVSRRLERASNALAEYHRTGKVRMVPAYAAGDERAGMSFEMDYYANPARGAVKEWSN
jgi:hypothetical protein